MLHRKGVSGVHKLVQIAGWQQREFTESAGQYSKLHKARNDVRLKSSKLETLHQPSEEQLAPEACSTKARSRSTTNFQTRASACLAAERAAFDAGLQPLLRNLVCSALVLLTSASSLAFVSPAAAGAAPMTVVSGTNQATSYDLGMRSAQSAVPLWRLAFVEYASVSDVPNPRTDHGGWVVDGASVMSDSQKEHIERVAQKLKDETGAEITVVTVDQLSRMTTPKAFATELFNTWGIGDQEKNNGVLVLLVKEQRRLEIEIGRGLNAPFNKASWLKGMQKQSMVPLLKKNDFGGGLVAGVDALGDKLRAVETEPAAPSAEAAKDMSDTFVWLGLFLGPLASLAAFRAYQNWRRERKQRKESSASVKGSSGGKSGSTGSGSRSYTRSTSYDDDDYYVGGSYRSGSSGSSSSSSSSSDSSYSSSDYGGGSSDGGGCGSDF
ncbi:hypothetical protein KFL_000630240 [Klebsormidium nitens]|uniref:TPM domain-containing protein n=1 Tax=Klebsormidium nitens TaxID=105231 RepID=A0A1Y1HV18_KLENI|nr:hypothetical protein KFL_000630240 [Klebsormidium nitens]|eukprot:GAQ80821.1 hypothetical protein KFL_000630240 [Klebsormidium nitens]